MQSGILLSERHTLHKEKKMKKLFATVLLTLTLLTTSLQSNAAVGLVTGTVPTVITGLVIAGGTLTYSLDESALFPAMGLMGTIFGLIILDGENQQEIAFNQIDRASANNVGVNEQERLIYNTEVDIANLLLEEVDRELQSIEGATEEDARNLWNEYQQYVSPETFKTMQLIVTK